MTTPNGTKIGESFGKTKGAKKTGTDKSNLNISSQELRITCQSENSYGIQLRRYDCETSQTQILISLDSQAI
jgi:hypothetical protein